MGRFRFYQRVILLLAFVLMLFIGAFSVVVYAKSTLTDIALQNATEAAPAIPTPSGATPAETLPELATQVFEQSQAASSAANDAQRYAQDASNSAGEHMEIANDLLGLFQNVTAIVGVLIPILALVGGYLGFNQLNEAQNRLEEARTGFQKDLEKRQEELEKVREALVHSARAQQDNVARATQALSLLPLGERQFRIGDYEGAIGAYERALELDPNSIIVHYRLGYVYTQSGKLEQAEQHLSAALKIEENFAPALACLGYVYRRIGEKMPDGVEHNIKLDQASTLLSRALGISPKLIDEEGESWWGSLGGLYRRRGQINDAIYAYNQVAKVTPNSSYAFGNLALLYAEKGDTEEMLKRYETMEPLAWGEVQGAPDNYWGFADLLTARLALGRVDKAEEALVAVFRTMPMESPYAWESLVETLHRLEDALGREKSAHIPSFIERIHAHVTAKKGAVSNGGSA